ncbi:MAG: methane monooxygenase/ammonia monooxygenase subunit B [Vicinamibacterales bacterium]
MRKVIRKVGALVAASALVTLAAPVAPANAHGEAAQEGWLRMGTVAFWDVEINGQPMGEAAVEVPVNGEFTVTGTVKVLETWPEQLEEPELGFISIVAPGPPVIIKERLVNGKPTPHSIQIEKGAVYNFEILLAGRRVSTGNGWHIHPIFAIHKAGSLIGPGNYVKVTGNDGDFKHEVALKSGGTIDLERFGLGPVILFNLIWFTIGMAWMIYWTVPKPTVTRLPVSLSVPLNSDGADAGLITKKDHQFCNASMALVLVILLGAFIWQGQKYPDKLPLQVLRYKPEPVAMDASFATLDADISTYDAEAQALTMTVDITNTGTTDAKITQYITSGDTYLLGDTLAVDNDTIPAGETVTVNLTMTSDRWDTERLVPTQETRPLITGVVRLEDGAGNENFLTASTFLAR